MAVKYKGQRNYVNAQRRLHAATGNKPQDYRTVRKRVTNITGLNEVRYDCCPNGCMSYSMYGQDVTHCLIDTCKQSRWKDPETKKRPYAQHSYLPVFHRLRIWWQNTHRAKKMIDYRKTAELDHSRNLRSDFWSGKLFQDLKKKGLFASETDLAFALSSDGVKVFKSRRAFYIWPLILVCLNLPPQERFKRRNILVVGFIPGPNNPKDMDSYLWPLVEEFMRLESGIHAYNGYRQRPFQLKAHICLVTGDMPGRSKMQGFKGSRALRYCPYCYIRAVNFNRTPYCPIHMPHGENVPINHDSRGKPYYDIFNLPLRNDGETREAARSIVSLGGPGEHLAKLHGINGEAILSRLKSIDMICSFPPDGMHLWWENIVPDLVKHWRGRFESVQTAAGNGTTGMTEGNYPNSNPERPTKRVRRNDGNAWDITAKASRSSTKFVRTSDPWNIPPGIWDRIGRDMAASTEFFPSQFGEAIRDFWEHSHHLKAAEWKKFGTVLLPIYLKEK